MRLLVSGSLALIILLGVVYTTAFAARQTTPEDNQNDEDELVTLTGRFVERIGQNEYLFDDGTSQIRVSGGPPWFHQIDLPLDQEVTITGEVDDGPPWLETPREREIDLFSVQLADGTVTTIRQQGRPPWAGGPKRVFGDENAGPGPPPWARGPKHHADGDVEDESRRPGPPPWARGPKLKHEDAATPAP